MKPDTINILGKDYSVEYLDKPSDVDVFKRTSLWGQVDPWTHSIRIYAPDDFSEDEILETLIHEILEVVAEKLMLKQFGDKENHDELSLVALADVMTRNNWLK